MMTVALIAGKLLLKRTGFGYAVLSDWEVLGSDLLGNNHVNSCERVDGVGCEDAELGMVDVACDEIEPARCHVYQLHIVYSPTYRVPVLYFNGKSHGTSCSPL